MYTQPNGQPSTALVAEQLVRHSIVVIILLSWLWHMDCNCNTWCKWTHPPHVYATQRAAQHGAYGRAELSAAHYLSLLLLFAVMALSFCRVQLDTLLPCIYHNHYHYAIGLLSVNADAISHMSTHSHALAYCHAQLCMLVLSVLDLPAYIHLASTQPSPENVSLDSLPLGV